jgi:hypothetical protein
LEEVEKGDLNEVRFALRMVITTEQKMEKPWAPFKLFQTVFWSSVDIQLEVTKR